MISSKEMARRIGKRKKLPLKTVQAVLTGLAEELTDAMSRSEEVTLWGIGRFRRKCFRSEKCTTPSTGAKPTIKNGVSFITAGRMLARLRECMGVFDEVEKL